MGPRQAQSIRAVFGAVLWNSGIIHDAMACASFLKFKQADGSGIVHTRVLSEINRGADNSAAVPDADGCPEIIADDPDGTSKTQNTQSVIMRKKTKSPAKTSQQKHQRHSVEVTCAARYLKENPEMQIDCFEIKSVIRKELETTETEDHATGNAANREEATTETEPEDQLPAAMMALEIVWNYVKTSCDEALFRDAINPSGGGAAPTAVDPAKSTPVKMRKERRNPRTTAMDVSTKSNKKERPRQVYTIGRSFLLGEFVE